MERCNLTIGTDASYYSKQQVGGYAFQIRYDDKLIKRFGPLKGKISNPTEAEMKALLNALHMVLKEDVKINTLTIRTDCEFIVEHMFKKNNRRKDVIKNLIEKMKYYFKKIDYKKLNIVHVRAHKEIETKAEYVNNWCDQHSKLGSRLAVTLLSAS